jgi:galactitol-specific phosphotransferase system IIB component
MLRVLVVCMGGMGTSVVLKDRLEKTIPGNFYATSALDKVVNVYEDYDVILTFKEIAPHVEKMLKEKGKTDYRVKSVEGFNEFAKDLFNDYLSQD